MKIKDDKRIFWGSIYYENTIFAIIVVAIVVFIGNSIFPKIFGTLLERTIPLFILVVCLEIFFIRKKLCKEIEEIKLHTENISIYQTFLSGEEFDNYLEYRTKCASEMKIIHISSFSSSAGSENEEGERSGRRYSKIIDDFLKSGKTFHRIFCDTSNKEVFQWIKDDIEKYKKEKYFINFLSNIKVENLRTIGIMIIDKEEVCLGGGYRTTYTNPTISIKNKVIAGFFNDYFKHLLIHSQAISSGDNIHWEFFDEHFINVEQPHD